MLNLPYSKGTLRRNKTKKSTNFNIQGQKRVQAPRRMPGVSKTKEENTLNTLTLEITLSSTVFEIQGFLCFAFLKKIRKFKMATIFGK